MVGYYLLTRAVTILTNTIITEGEIMYLIGEGMDWNTIIEIVVEFIAIAIVIVVAVIAVARDLL